jgi:hypothetical protein
MNAVIELHSSHISTSSDARTESVKAKASLMPAHPHLINKSFCKKARKYWLLET